MFGVARFEMSKASEEDSGSAEVDCTTSEHRSDDRTGSDEGLRSGHTNGLATGDEPIARTEIPSDDRSVHSSGSVLAGPATPGSTGSLLVQLSSDIGDDLIVARFVHDYLELLDSRLDRLRPLLEGSDADATRLSILSLESSSAMLGATDMVQAAQTLRLAVAASKVNQTQSLLLALNSRAAELRQRLAGLGFVSRPAAG